MGKCPVPGNGAPSWLSRRLALALAAIGFLIFVPLYACTAPDVEDEIAAPADAEAPVILGARGPLSSAESEAVLARLAETTAEATALQRHAAIEEAVAETPLVAGNATRVLRDGPESFAAIFAAIRAATDHVNLEYYILGDVEHEGAWLGDLLVAKLGQGVAVNIIYDSFGSIDTPAEFFDRLAEAGARVVEFHPVNPLEAGEGYAPNDRNHRKILVVDGRIAIIGGVNLAEDYQSLGSFPSGSGDDDGGGTAEGKAWRDTNLRLEGPVVAQLQSLFLEHWAVEGGPALDGARLFPIIAAAGGEVARIIGSTPEAAVPRFYVTLLTAIRNARERVWLTNAYFIPPEQAVEDLVAAARAGVDVRLLLPGVSDVDEAIDAARANYSDLLEAGVRIFEMQDAILHAKSGTVDGVWSVIGSSNIDYRSVIFNDEVDAVVLGSDTADQLDAMFEADMAGSREITLEAWRNRPLSQRLEEFFSRIWESWL